MCCTILLTMKSVTSAPAAFILPPPGCLIVLRFPADLSHLIVYAVPQPLSLTTPSLCVCVCVWGGGGVVVCLTADLVRNLLPVSV